MVGLATEAETGALPVTAALVRQHRVFLGRCAPNTLDAVFPAGSTMNDPQVVMILQNDLDCARAADADYARAGRGDDVDHADRAWQRILSVPAVGYAYPDLRAALLNDAAATALRRSGILPASCGPPASRAAVPSRPRLDPPGLCPASVPLGQPRHGPT